MEATTRRNQNTYIEKFLSGGREKINKLKQVKRIKHGDMFLVAAQFAVTSLVIIVCKANVYMLYMCILLLFFIIGKR